MTSGNFETIKAGGAMVKAVNRKSRTFQTPGEKIYSLEEHNTRLRERLLFVNRFEDARLERLQRQITSNEHANIGRILRRKDQTKVTLINIASTKRKVQANEGEFERRLKNGTNSPVFAVELDRVRRREQELSELRRKLQGPNSQFLAAHLRDELRNIESRIDASPSRLTSTNPSSVAGSYSQVKKLNNDQDAGTNLTNNHLGEHSENMPVNSSLEELVSEVHTKMSQTNISRPKSSSPIHEEQVSNFPVTQPVEQNKMDQLGGDIAIPVSSGETNLSRPAKLEGIPENKVISVAIPKRELPPLRVTRNKKQKYLALMQQKLSRTPTARDLQVSNSALNRERHALKRVAELKVKTREDIQGRRTADSDDSLGSIKQQETVTRLQTNRTSAGSTQLPTVGKDPEKRAKPRENLQAPRKRSRRRGAESAAGTGVSLPPIRIDVGILKELKESRRRHKHQCHKLPKLP